MPNSKKTLGQLVKQQREELGLTQRELAEKSGIKASHIAYIEQGQRRPSLALLGRMVDVIGLNKEELFLLAHPEARYLINRPEEAARRPDAWQAFANNKALQARYRVTPSELRILKQISTLGPVSSPRQFIFILNTIRQAGER